VPHLKETNLQTGPGAPLVRRLGPADLVAMRALNGLFGEVFDDQVHYAGAPPDDAYFAATLAKPHVIALVAEVGGDMAGGLVGYVLDKLEQARSEIYIYDLAVAEAFRRQGVATALIARLCEIGAALGAWVVYVQADYGDEPAVALYTKLGVREDVMHFDIAVNGRQP
jgi:aminoglycoside 3-N-acetyltransferase I